MINTEFAPSVPFSEMVAGLVQDLRTQVFAHLDAMIEFVDSLTDHDDPRAAGWRLRCSYPRIDVGIDGATAWAECDPPTVWHERALR